MMKKLGFIIVLAMCVCIAGPAFAANFTFHGDMNHRFEYTSHNEWITAAGGQGARLGQDTNADFLGEIKYRFWFTAATNDNNVKGVFATEIGGLRFGEPGKLTYSGDKIMMEVRWGYIDFQLPGVSQKARFKIGLQPFKVNPYLWVETAAGISFDSAMSNVDYKLAWMRGYEIEPANSEDSRSDTDAFLARLDTKPADGAKAGFFFLFQRNNADIDAGAGTPGFPVMFAMNPANYEIKNITMAGNGADIAIYTIGTDGSYNAGDFFINWDLMYEGGDIADVTWTGADGLVSPKNKFDLSAYFLHADLGFKMDNAKVTYTFYYASGDDDSTDGDFDAFISTDVDRTDSITLMEGGFADDNYFTERPYILDKGFIMNKLALSYKASDKLTVGAAAMYMMTAEDIEYTDGGGVARSDDTLGVELNGFMKYMIYKNLEFSFNMGYLVADDAMDYFEATKDGDSDVDIFIMSSRIRYKF